MVKIWGQIKGHFFLSILLKELSYLGIIALWDCSNQLFSLFQIFIQNCSLEIQDWEQKSVSVNIKTFIDQIESILFSIVP
jgi:hypothetical protein